MAFLKGPKFDFHLHRKGSGNGGMDAAEQQRHQELERLYTSTRAGKHFQKDIVKGIENFISVGNKQLDVSNRLAEDCRKYGSDGPSVKEALSRVTLQYSSARIKMEKERESFHRSLATQVAEPLKGMVHGSPLEDARHLKQKYDRLRQDADNQASEVHRREAKDPNSSQDYVAKLQAAKHKMQEIAAAMDTMGRNATSAMSVVEAQQQSTTLQKMLAMVGTERAYFQRVTGILDQLHYEIEAEVRRSSNSSVSLNSSNEATPYPQTPSQSTPPSTTVRHMSVDPPESSYHAANGGSGYHASVDPPESSYHTANGGSAYHTSDGGYEELGIDRVPTPEETQSFYAIVTHDFEGEDEGELTISVGDEVLVRQVTSAGWSEGACNGQSGWFPSTYVEKKQPTGRGRGRSGSSHGSR